jgi:hypothetical protein
LDRLALELTAREEDVKEREGAFEKKREAILPSVERAERTVLEAKEKEREAELTLQEATVARREVEREREEVSRLETKLQRMEREFSFKLGAVEEEKLQLLEERRQLQETQHRFSSQRMELHAQYMQVSKHTHQVHRMMSLLRSLPFEQFLTDASPSSSLPSWQALNQWTQQAAFDTSLPPQLSSSPSYHPFDRQQYEPEEAEEEELFLSSSLPRRDVHTSSFLDRLSSSSTLFSQLDLGEEENNTARRTAENNYRGTEEDGWNVTFKSLAMGKQLSNT